MILYDWESPRWGPPVPISSGTTSPSPRMGCECPWRCRTHSGVLRLLARRGGDGQRPEDVPDPQVVEYLRRGVSRLRSGSVASA